MARTAQNNIHWRGNMHYNQQHRVQTIQLYYNAAKKYKKPIHAETGKRLKYDTDGLLLRPEKLTSAFQDQKQEEGKNKKQHMTGKTGELSENTRGFTGQNISAQ